MFEEGAEDAFVAIARVFLASVRSVNYYEVIG
jgi:hypothetical protein